MKSIHAKALAMAVAVACASDDVRASGGEPLAPAAAPPYAASGGGLNLRQAARPEASFFGLEHRSDAEPGGAIASTTYRPPGDLSSRGIGLRAAPSAPRPSQPSPSALVDFGQHPPVSVGSVLGAVLWGAAEANNPRRDSLAPMANHRPHAIPYSGEITTRGFGWR